MRKCYKCKKFENETDFGANKSYCKPCIRHKYLEKNGKNCSICQTKHSRSGTLYCSLKCTIIGKTEKQNSCWIWKGSKSGDGYGVIKEIDSRKQVGVHRKSYEIFKGEIAKGYCVCHTCDNPLCCNPEHLFLGTPRDNTKDSVKKGRARACKQEGSKNTRAKLNESIVKKIKELFIIGWQCTDICDLTGIPIKTLQEIKYNKTWRHVLLE